MSAAATGCPVADRVSAVRRRIADAAGRAGRDPERVRLVTVTKTVDAERVRQAIEAGCHDLGENRVQEAVVKREELPGTIRWHLLGHLQTNKAGRAAGLFDVVHSVDSRRIAGALAARRPERLGALDVLLEVELTGLPGRTGYAEAALDAAAQEVGSVEGLRLRGLMTMAAPVGDPEEARPTFARLRRLRDRLEAEGLSLPELSMGMSDDFEIAVEEGATIVRLGRAIFGERPARRG